MSQPAWAQAGQAETGTAAPASTGDATTADPGSTRNDQALGDIVVTATRRSESLQKVPISLQALSADKLAQRQVNNFADYVQLLPSVSFDTLGPGRSNVYFRGISVGGNILPTTATYLDDIPNTTAGATPEVHIYDVERVEALSGPQGTLFGANSLAGTLRIITNKPKIGSWEGGYDAQLNKYGAGEVGGEFEGYANMPLGENAAIRLMGFYNREGGYIDNLPASHTYTFGLGEPNNPNAILTRNNSNLVGKNYNPVTEYGGRASVRVDIADGWSLLPSVTYQHLVSHGTFLFDPRFSGLAVRDYTPTMRKDNWYQASLTVQGKIADFDVVALGGYFNRHTRTTNDYSYYSIDYDNLAEANGVPSYYYFRNANGKILDPTQYFVGSDHYQKATGELRISTPKSWKLQLTSGVFYQWQQTDGRSDYIFPGVSTGYFGTDYNVATNVFTPTNPAPAVRGDSLYDVYTRNIYNDLGLYAEGTYPILDNLKITGGIRYFSTKNSVYGFGGTYYSALDAGCTVPFAVTGLACINDNGRYHQTGQTHKVTLTWQVTPNKLTYFTYSTGFRPGGTNNLPGTRPYKADTLSNYELGFKTQWGRILRWNAAVYYEQWKGVQYTEIVPNTAGNIATINAGDARVYGIETDFDLRLGPVTLSGSGAYNDARLSTDFCDVVSLQDFVPRDTCSAATRDLAAAKGTRLPRQPRFKVQASARYEFLLGDYHAFLQGVALHQSGSTSDLNAANDVLFGDPSGFYSFDFSSGISQGKWHLEAFIQNAFNSRGVLSRNAFCEIQTCRDGSRSFPIKPRYFGIKFGQKF